MPSYQEQEWERLSIKRKKSVASLAASAIEPPAHFYALRVPDHQLKAIDNKAVRKFYEVLFFFFFLLLNKQMLIQFISIKIKSLINTSKWTTLLNNLVVVPKRLILLHFLACIKALFLTKKHHLS